VTRDEALTLLDYHYWARDRVLAAVEALTPEQYTRDLGNSFASVHATLVHTCGAEWLWYHRWMGHSPSALPDVTAYRDLQSLRDAWTSLESQVRSFVGGLESDGLARVYPYTQLNGTKRSSAFSHMLQHLVNHATYHRGQLTTMLRQLGAPAPTSQDLIAFYWERYPEGH
jgi:uncharacterized damage-inducible protein DinB